jgi:putative NADH-flavin reductase
MQSRQKIGIFGGTNGVGKECLVQALKEGHQVTVLARDKTKIKECLENKNLIVI